jgi:hypothetical protein
MVSVTCSKQLGCKLHDDSDMLHDLCLLIERKNGLCLSSKVK